MLGWILSPRHGRALATFCTVTRYRLDALLKDWGKAIPHFFPLMATAGIALSFASLLALPGHLGRLSTMTAASAQALSIAYLVRGALAALMPFLLVVWALSTYLAFRLTFFVAGGLLIVLFPVAPYYLRLERRFDRFLAAKLTVAYAVAGAVIVGGVLLVLTDCCLEDIAADDLRRFVGVAALGIGIAVPTVYAIPWLYGWGLLTGFRANLGRLHRVAAWMRAVFLWILGRPHDGSRSRRASKRALTGQPRQLTHLRAYFTSPHTLRKHLLDVFGVLLFLALLVHTLLPGLFVAINWAAAFLATLADAFMGYGRLVEAAGPVTPPLPATSELAAFANLLGSLATSPTIAESRTIISSAFARVALGMGAVGFMLPVAVRTITSGAYRSALRVVLRNTLRAAVLTLGLGWLLSTGFGVTENRGYLLLLVYGLLFGFMIEHDEQFGDDPPDKPLGGSA